MSDSEPEELRHESSSRVRMLVRTAVVIALVALSCVLAFLIAGFRAWSVGLGTFLGAPLLTVAMGIYLFAVFLDLKNRDVF